MRRLFVLGLFAAAFLALAVAMLAYLGVFRLGPGEAERAELDRRWVQLLEHAAPLPGPGNPELATLAERGEALGAAGRASELATRPPDDEERELLGDLCAWIESTPPPRLGQGDLALLLPLARFALAAARTEEVPLDAMLDLSLRLVERGATIEAVGGLQLAVEIREAVAAVDPESELLANARRPQPADLARAILRGAVRWTEEVPRDPMVPPGRAETPVWTSADAFLLHAQRLAAVEYGEDLWGARDDLDALAAVPVGERPSLPALYLGTITRDPGPLAREMHCLVAVSTAALVERWRELLRRFDAAGG